MKQFVLFFISLFLLSVGARSQEIYQKKVFISSRGDSLNYRLLRPEVEKTGLQYPLVLFLHGAGERGSDNEKQLTHGGQMFLNPVNREKYPAFVLVPQCPEKDYWAYTSRPSSFIPSEMPAGQEITPVLRAVKELLDTYLDLPQVDRNRIYVVGLSGRHGDVRSCCPFSRYVCCCRSHLRDRESGAFGRCGKCSFPYFSR